MRMKSLAALSLALALTAPEIAAAAEPKTLQPTSQWRASRVGNKCLLISEYQEPNGSPLTFYLQRKIVGEGLEILIEREVGEKGRQHPDSAFLQGDVGGKVERISPVTYEMASGRYISFIKTEMSPLRGPSIEWHKLNEKEKLAQEAADEAAERIPLLGESLIVSLEDQFAYRFMTPRLNIAQRTLDQCLNVLRAEYGVSQEDIDAVVTQPVMTKIGLDTGDYPTDMVRAGRDGEPTAFFWVNIEGRVEGCRILETSGQAAFDDVICKRMEKKMRFDPGLDKDGNPVRAPVIKDIYFQMAI